MACRLDGAKPLSPFSRILDEKKKTFQPKSLILKSYKTPLFKTKCDFIFIIQDKVPLSRDWLYQTFFSTYIVFFQYV